MDDTINIINGLRAYDSEREWFEIFLQLHILTEVRNDPNITKPELADKLKLGKTTVDKGISVLKKSGFIERVGSNKSGYWKVLK